MTFSYRHTRIACYMGYITQAITNNLSPLLFLTYQQEFSLSLSQISLMITVNFSVQIAVDLLSTKFVDKIGYRASMILAQVLSITGLIGLGILPALLTHYTALMLSTVLCALGGGLLEVLVSPILEALPSDRKASEMSLLHSFYCWGHVGVVLLSTAYFLLIGRSYWRVLPLLWALVPMATGVLFAKVPLCKLTQDGQSMPVRRLAITPVFWVFMLLMVCAGASEQAMSQWASLFAEKGLNVSKTLGDLLGPCAFATLMGVVSHAVWPRSAFVNPQSADDQRSWLRSKLSAHDLFSLAHSFAGWLCTLRVLCGCYVARCFLHRIGGSPCWRHGDVCFACPGWRCGLLCWTRFGGRNQRWRNGAGKLPALCTFSFRCAFPTCFKNGIFAGNCFSAAAVAGNGAVEKNR